MFRNFKIKGVELTPEDMVKVVKHYNFESTKEYVMENYPITEGFAEIISSTARDFMDDNIFAYEKEAVSYAFNDNSYYEVLRCREEELLFCSKKLLLKKGKYPTLDSLRDDYKVVLIDGLDLKESIEKDYDLIRCQKIYDINNRADRPFKNEISSMSIGDVIYIHKAGDCQCGIAPSDCYYFVDRYGFEEICGN